MNICGGENEQGAPPVEEQPAPSLGVELDVHDLSLRSEVGLRVLALGVTAAHGAEDTAGVDREVGGADVHSRLGSVQAGHNGQSVGPLESPSSM